MFGLPGVDPVVLPIAGSFGITAGPADSAILQWSLLTSCTGFDYIIDVYESTDGYISVKGSTSKTNLDNPGFGFTIGGFSYAAYLGKQLKAKVRYIINNRSGALSSQFGY